jgi:hypothetical protein
LSKAIYQRVQMDCPATPFRYLDEAYIHEKYAGGAVQADGGHRTDSVPVEVHVLDARPSRPTSLLQTREQLEKSGFCLVDFDEDEQVDFDVSNMEHDDSLQKTYFKACEKLALRSTGANYARAFNFVLRSSRIKGVHTKPGGDRSARGPVNDVHTDYTDESPGVQQIKYLVDNKLGLGGARFALFNLWRSVGREPVQTWPLAVCDASSVDPKDLIGRITPENDNVIYSVLPNPNHKWRYYSRMERNECLVFKQYDTNEHALSRFTPHTAFDLLAAGMEGRIDGSRRSPVPTRESCEVRVLVVFDDEHGTHSDALRGAATQSGTLAYEVGGQQCRL